MRVKLILINTYNTHNYILIHHKRSNQIDLEYNFKSLSHTYKRNKRLVLRVAY